MSHPLPPAIDLSRVNIRICDEITHHNTIKRLDPFQYGMDYVDLMPLPMLAALLKSRTEA